jgi:hypothetical protein
MIYLIKMKRKFARAELRRKKTLFFKKYSKIIIIKNKKGIKE